MPTMLLLEPYHCFYVVIIIVNSVSVSIIMNDHAMYDTLLVEVHEFGRSQGPLAPSGSATARSTSRHACQCQSCSVDIHCKSAN